MIVNVRESAIYKEYLAMKEEVEKHKWFESEKAGHDIGFVKALIDWTVKFKTKWVQSRKD